MGWCGMKNKRIPFLAEMEPGTILAIVAVALIASMVYQCAVLS